MHRWRMTSAVTVVAVTLWATAVHAFDGNRKGFILGGGIVPAFTSYSVEVSDDFFGNYTTDRETKFGLATDFRIGGGITDKVMLYYANKVSWFSVDGEMDGSVTIAHGIGLIGVSYYLEAAAPSVYFVGTLGLSSWSAPFEENSDTWSGFGVGGGVGYEFAKHWSVEGMLTWGNPGDDYTTIDAFSFLVTITGIAY
ncbi:MAG: hypothetical protein H6Q78_1240 [Candidatus Krumholzibacteriota bacterium]|nr:hypothetical protein [Candidatus Krumholzibacteriota bacterium]